jgi:hypothetical protein
MISADFRRRVLKPVQSRLRRVTLPSSPTWLLHGENDLRAIVQLTSDHLCGNMQGNAPAAPLFLLCLVIRLRAAGEPWKGVVRLPKSCLDGIVSTGQPPSSEELHLARSLYLLHLYEEIFHDYFVVEVGLIRFRGQVG